jgi:hypothetical protein
MTLQQIAPHQVRVREVWFLAEWQAITGDTWESYQAPDGEIVEVRTRCGAYAPRAGTWTSRQAHRFAIRALNLRRQARAGRIAVGLPVTCQLTSTAPAARKGETDAK